MICYTSLQMDGIVTVLMLFLIPHLLVAPCTGNTLPQEDDIYMESCRQALGMQSGQIGDSAITASSSYDEKSVGPLNSRLHAERNGGAWCPREPVSRDTYEWLQINFDQLTVISLVETQGRFGNGQGQEYAPLFALEYQRVDGTQWIRYKTMSGTELLEGNVNTYTPHQREVNPPIIARRLRFVPYSNIQRTICMRVEVFGCQWQDSLVSYSMAQGDSRGPGVELLDDTYDGVTSANNTLSGGLGQLTDHVVGYYNFRLDLQGVGKKGYEWVGWRNDTRPPNTPVEITFEFDRVRNFTSVRLHANNMFTKEVRVFKRAELFFSVGGRYYVSEPIVYEPLRDVIIEFARYVTIPLPQMFGRYVKMLLHFDARWIMLSEVTFQSAAVNGYVPEETAPPTTIAIYSSDKPRLLQPLLVSVANEESESGSGVKVANAVAANSRSRQSAEEMSDVQGQDRRLTDTQIGIIIGALSAMIILLIAIITLLAIRRNRTKRSDKHQPFFQTDPLLPALRRPAADDKPGSITTSRYSPVGTSDSEEAKYSQHLPAALACSDRRQGSVAKQQESATACPTVRQSRATSVTDCESECQPYSTLDATMPRSQYSTWVGSDVTADNRPVSHVPVAMALTPTRPGLSPTYPGTAIDIWLQEPSIPEYPRHNLHSLEKLGDGQFGEVLLCEALDTVQHGSKPHSVLVAVKILRQDAAELVRSDFHKEVRIMSRLKDPNIVHVLGVCLREEPLCVVIEYLPHGDLNEFLTRHQLEDVGRQQQSLPLISYGALIYMATQIASGMKYLESLNMVHRDLASRNCLVGDLYAIKISDFGMSRSLYSSDYYRIEGKALLPIRWMAWESTLLGKFSCKSDIWSFAVTLWETLTLARCRPFDQLTDEQVLDNLGHYFHNDGRQVILPQPACCPREIYDLMTECWNRDDKQRPSFREIHIFLLRKNMGYDPAADLRHMGSYVI